MSNFIKTLLIGCTLASVMHSYTVQADDTELYVLNVSQTNGVRPKILVILDNSGSMISGYVSPYFSYDITKNYIPSSNSDILSNRAFLSNSASSLPPFYTGLHNLSTNYQNNCEASYASLDVSPYYYVGKFRSPVTTNSRSGTTYSWGNLNNGNVLDCYADASSNNTLNRASGANGYPVNANGHYATSGAVSADFTSSLTEQYLFSANYLYYRTKTDIGKASN